ncbi:MAG: Transglutaminase-like superfamily protein [Candidatus Izimaplasma bacterium HR2]|nr:MAG: Transglutaminase-like superfamily protein [Candidatus Izimaplasma bacterium HR2]
MKKILACIMALILLITFAFGCVAEIDIGINDDTIIIDTSNYEETNFVVVVEKDTVNYLYFIGAETISLPIQMGDGDYIITLLTIENRRGKVISKKSINIDVNEEEVFLSSHQLISWNDELKAVILAKKLTKDIETDKEKFEIIYDYIINNITYDYKKLENINNLPRNYIPKADDILETGKGICSDFATLTAVMLRAVDIPTKYIKGYTVYTPVYHGWNEVFIDGEWIIVDTSTDSIALEHNAYLINKTNEEYFTSKEY